VEHQSGVGIDWVFFVYLDLGFLSAAAEPAQIDDWFRWRWAGVVTAPQAVRGVLTTFAGRERVLSAKHCHAVVVTDAAFVEPCQKSWPGRRVISMPEIADVSPPGTPDSLAELHAFARGRSIVGLLGVISEKKNVEAFVALARRAERELPGTVFVLAGDFSRLACPGPERRRLMKVVANLPNNCRLFGHPLDDGPEFNTWLATCDAVWLAYRNFAYNSNVLTKAAYFRKPVLVSPGAIMAEHAQRFRLGEAVSVTDITACLAAVRRLLANPATDRKFAEFAASNSAQSLGRTTKELERVFGP
jgi:glycosyltransferase involved in cell wall biosynthesis